MVYVVKNLAFESGRMRRAALGDLHGMGRQNSHLQRVTAIHFGRGWRQRLLARWSSGLSGAGVDRLLSIEAVPFDLRHLRVLIYTYDVPGMRMFEQQLSKAIIDTLDRY